MIPGVLEIRRDGEEAVYEQIARSIRSWIAGGKLAAGDALPSVRSLASDLGVNLNTVARAYRMLEDEGFLEIQDRRGVVVAPPRRHRARGNGDLPSELREILAKMRQSGWSPKELRALLAKELERLDHT